MKCKLHLNSNAYKERISNFNEKHNKDTFQSNNDKDKFNAIKNKISNNSATPRTSQEQIHSEDDSPFSKACFALFRTTQLTKLDTAMFLDIGVEKETFARAMKILSKCGIITLLEDKKNKNNIYIWKNKVDKNDFAIKLINEFLK
jgi:hypothetical protein